MKIKRKQKTRNDHAEKIKNLISFNNRKNPFKDQKDSEEFFKSIIEQEMNLSNNYNSENLNSLLNLYLKGINLYQNTPNTDKVKIFLEKSQLLLQSSKAKKVLNESKTKKHEVSEIKTDSTLNDENEEIEYSNKNKINESNEEENDTENKLKFDFKRYKTIRHNEIQNRNKLNYLSNTIKSRIKEKNNQKQKINEINKEYKNIREQQLKTSIFLEDELNKQSNNFKVNLIRKRTIYNKAKNIKLKIDTIQEENDTNKNIKIKIPEKNNISNKIIKIGRNKTPKNNNINSENVNFIKLENKSKLKRKSFSFFIKKEDKDNKKNNHDVNNKIQENHINVEKVETNNSNDKLKIRMNKYIEEFNEDISKYYFTSSINKISDLVRKLYKSNLNIYEGYQKNIKELLKKQISCSDKEEENILEDDINSLKEEQDHEIEKNNDLYEKLIEEEISTFKLFGYSNSALKELDILKNKIKCDLYNEVYNILNK